MEIGARGVGDGGPVDPDVGVVHEAVAASDLGAAGTPVLALVSGGRDSVCLLDALVAVRGAAAVCVLHVNYGLRPGDCDADEQHVRALCERFGVEFSLECAGAPVAGNLQAWARDLRYGRAAVLAQERGGLIATGHTATDQLECVLYRLAASPGRRALLGMAARDGRLVRPLLTITREQTAAYCAARGLEWREDASNADPRFARARVRHGLAAELARLHPAAAANALRSVELLREEAAVLDELVARTLAGRSAIELAQLRALPPALARLVVVRLAEQRAAGGFVPGAGARVDELLGLAPGGGSAALDLGGGVRAVVEYGVLRFERADDWRVPRGALLGLPGTAAFGRWALAAALADRPDAAALAALFADPDVAVLDADLLAGSPLAVRAWRSGDRIEPIGLGGSSTLADLFAARRIPRAQRGAVPVIACDERIAWVPGVATAAGFRVQPNTQRVAVLSARRHTGED